MSKTEELFKQTSDAALQELEGLVREAFRQDSRLTDFVIAMGSATFHAKRIGIIDDGYMDKYPAIKPVFDFLDEWDEYLHLSGAGLWFKRDGSILTDW